ncbi:uncharacterized protein LOC121482904 [Vulpes lagopus]|uniref:uncharacterized protein LOC121482904 n=1 Tax=Vulpes lagopus TaxID=494514 RepID=UPI001BC9A44F|nr:uncharacterized protein LOC121482904 [Vulpes lagopus]
MRRPHMTMTGVSRPKCKTTSSLTAHNTGHADGRLVYAPQGRREAPPEVLRQTPGAQDAEMRAVRSGTATSRACDGAAGWLDAPCCTASRATAAVTASDTARGTRSAEAGSQGRCTACVLRGTHLGRVQEPPGPQSADAVTGFMGPGHAAPVRGSQSSRHAPRGPSTPSAGPSGSPGSPPSHLVLSFLSGCACAGRPRPGPGLTWLAAA